MSSDKEWNEKLFGCTKDCGICCYGFCCTPCLFGSNAKKIDDKNCVVMCCVYGLLANIYLCWVPHLFERRTLREKYNLKEDSTCGDIGATLCCGPCALCQEAREMKSRENKQSVPYKANASSPPVVSQPRSDPDVKTVDPAKARF